MNKLTIFLGTVLAAVAAGCSESQIYEEPTQGAEVPEGEMEVALNLNVVNATVVGKPLINSSSRADGDGDGSGSGDASASEKESSVHDIWVFQFAKTGEALVAPRYYTVTSDVVEHLNIRLAEAEECHLYVLANTGDEEWVSGKDFSTLEKFKAFEVPFSQSDIVRDAEKEYIPMIGDVAGLTFRKQADLKPVDIYLTRMLSKISFSYETLGDATALICNRIIINNLPTKIKIEHNDEASVYPSEDDFETQTYTFIDNLEPNRVYTFYMPENRRGTTSNTDPGTKNDGAPEKALYVQLFISSRNNGSNFLYTIYLGENDKNDFNVRRNHNYNIKLTLRSENRDNRVLAAPANCFVLGHNEEIMFDPYSRTETGGGFRYSDYVNKSVPGKQVKSVGILWQQARVIGDNSAGNRVWMDEFNRVHVRSGATNGNAVIAGYNGANRTGDIVWSWHIWVNNEKPAKLSAAIPYSTWEYTSSSINTSKRVKGRSIMSCNLGALSVSNSGTRAYGTIYQWGRKDPFPHAWAQAANYSAEFNYNSTTVGKLYNNSYSEIAMTGTGGANTSEVFSTKPASATVGNIDYVVKHPTHFIRTLISDTQSEAASAYYNDGDWFWGHNDYLWGGKPETQASVRLLIATGTASGNAYLANNGAKEKSIFDPCPAGWMLAPAEMWIGFTKSGKNETGSFSNVFATGTTNGYIMKLGMTPGAAGAPTSFFPSQGLRLCNGKAQRNGICGNYETSSPGVGGKVNIFHLHRDAGATVPNISPFEGGYQYTRRGVAGPVRCMRDTDD